MTYTYTEIPSWKTRLSIGGTCVEFVSCDITEQKDLVADDGLRGTRTRQMERLALGQTHIGGSIVMQPTPADMTLVLPFLLNSGNADLLTDIMQDVTVIVDTFTQASTYVGRFTRGTLSGSPGQPLNLKLDFVGKSASFAGGGTLSTAPDTSNRKYMFADSGSSTALTINSTAYSISKFELVVDNKIVPTYMNGQLPTDLEPTDRICTLSIETRYAVEQALLTLAQAGPVIGSPLAGSIGFTNGTNSMGFTWAAMAAHSRTVSIPGGHQNLRLPLTYDLLGVSATKEMTTTLV